MNLYPALIYAKDGGFGVSVVDLPGCKATGRTQHDAVRNAIVAVAKHIEMLSEKNAEIPRPRSFDDANRESHPQMVARLMIPCEVVGRVVRLNISMDETIVNMADRRSTSLGMTRSGYIAHLIRAETAGKAPEKMKPKGRRRKSR